MENKRQNDEKQAVGKFASTDELLTAYNALESEFTKRCQLIKQLQARIDALAAQAEERTANDNTAVDAAEQAKGDVSDAIAAAKTSASPEPSAPTAIEQASEEFVRAADAPSERTTFEAPPQAPPVQTEAVVRIEQRPSAEEILAEIAAHADDYAELIAAIPQVMNECIARYKHDLLCSEFGMPIVRGAAVLTPVSRPRTLVDAKRIADRLLK